MAALRTHRDRAMVAAMVLGGLRRCEVLGLRLEDLRVAERQVFIAEGRADRYAARARDPAVLRGPLNWYRAMPFSLREPARSGCRPCSPGVTATGSSPGPRPDYAGATSPGPTASPNSTGPRTGCPNRPPARSRHCSPSTSQRRPDSRACQQIPARAPRYRRRPRGVPGQAAGPDANWRDGKGRRPGIIQPAGLRQTARPRERQGHQVAGAPGMRLPGTFASLPCITLSNTESEGERTRSRRYDGISCQLAWLSAPPPNG